MFAYIKYSAPSLYAQINLSFVSSIITYAARPLVMYGLSVSWTPIMSSLQLSSLQLPSLQLSSPQLSSLQMSSAHLRSAHLAYLPLA